MMISPDHYIQYFWNLSYKLSVGAVDQGFPSF